MEETKSMDHLYQSFLGFMDGAVVSTVAKHLCSKGLVTITEDQLIMEIRNCLSISQTVVIAPAPAPAPEQKKTVTRTAPTGVTCQYIFQKGKIMNPCFSLPTKP